MLEIVPEKSGKGKVKFTSSGIDIPSGESENLCEKVYRLTSAEFDLRSVKMHLHKMIPIGAGLGGGSADAAFVAAMLNHIFELGLSIEKLEDIVAQVGSDCPFFVRNKPAFVTGRGEMLEPFDLDLSGYWIMLVNPRIHVGTKEAYAGIVPAVSRFSLKESLSKDITEWKGLVRNDFESSIFPKYRAIQQLKAELYEQGADYASMTGSGSTVYGLFSSEPRWSGAKDFQVKIAQL